MYNLYDNMNICIRDVNKHIFIDFKARAIKKHFTIGKAITLAMKDWSDAHEEKKSVLSVKPIDWGKGTEKSSATIDKELYA